MCPKIQVYKDVAGKTRFRIRANNNQIVAVGEAYEKYASCIKGIESVKRNCNAPIEDLTMEGGPKLPNPKYQIFKDKADKFRFHLKAANGEIIAQGEGYESMEGCLNGIEVVRDCANAEIEDPFAITSEKPEPILAKPAVNTKNLTPAAPTLIEEKEMIPEVGPVETTLELYAAPGNIAKGDKINFQGRLFKRNTGKGISAAKIRIYERDKSILGDDYLAYGSTGQDGSFSIPWKTRSLTMRKNTGNIYAKFSGNEKAKPSQSTTQEITIK